MKIKFFLISVSLALSATTSFAQMMPSPSPTRQRIIIVGAPQNVSHFTSETPTPTPTPTPSANVVITNTLPPAPKPTPTPYSTPTPSVPAITNPTPIDRPAINTVLQPTQPIALPTVSAPFIPNPKLMSLGELRGKIFETKRLMQTRPMPTALTDSFLVTDVVRLGFYDWDTKEIDFVPLTKTVFLTKGAELPTLSSNGKKVTVRIVRANGVNTAAIIYDEKNQPHTPLLVQYPIEKYGKFVEMAYYISTHPGVVTPEVINAGKLYVRNTIDIARQKLQEKGIFITPQVADIAERLSTVEHVDHQRFWTEYQPNVYNEIFTLYALNETNTYRYSVSSAGAGGMVQMIPATYAMMRNRYYNVGLIPDFVEGMRNHVNAAQAMLLYMQMTWNDLSANDTITEALSTGIATQADLMAAGYNSNPARLALYIRRGGANWRTLIPRETKIYLQIYASLEGAVPMMPRTK